MREPLERRGEEHRDTGGRPRGIAARISDAAAGVAVGWREEAAFRNQVLGAVAMLAVLLAVQPRPLWWALALFASLLTLALELLNSAIEGTLDRLHPEHHPAVKKIKDLSGASVVVASAGVLVVGVLMLADTLALDG